MDAVLCGCGAKAELLHADEAFCVACYRAHPATLLQPVVPAVVAATRGGTVRRTCPECGIQAAVNLRTDPLRFWPHYRCVDVLVPSPEGILVMTP